MKTKLGELTSSVSSALAVRAVCRTIRLLLPLPVAAATAVDLWPCCCLAMLETHMHTTRFRLVGIWQHIGLSAKTPVKIDVLILKQRGYKCCPVAKAVL